MPLSPPQYSLYPFCFVFFFRTRSPSNIYRIYLLYSVYCPGAYKLHREKFFCLKCSLPEHPNTQDSAWHVIDTQWISAEQMKGNQWTGRWSASSVLAQVFLFSLLQVSAEHQCPYLATPMSPTSEDRCDTGHLPATTMATSQLARPTLFIWHWPRQRLSWGQVTSNLEQEPCISGQKKRVRDPGRGEAGRWTSQHDLPLPLTWIHKQKNCLFEWILGEQEDHPQTSLLWSLQLWDYWTSVWVPVMTFPNFVTWGQKSPRAPTSSGVRWDQRWPHQGCCGSIGGSRHTFLLPEKSKSFAIIIISKNRIMKIMASSPITSWQVDGETVETVTGYFLGLQNHCRWGLQPWSKKTLTPWKESYDQPRQHIKKQRHCFANKGPSSQSYGFSSGNVWMWALDYKESWAPKNWCFELWCWRRLLRVPWTARRSNQSILKEISLEY